MLVRSVCDSAEGPMIFEPTIGNSGIGVHGLLGSTRSGRMRGRERVNVLSVTCFSPSP